MKPVYKCDYCEHMGTEEDVREHEAHCIHNYDKQSCYTCIHRDYYAGKKGLCFKCKNGVDLPEGNVFEYCPKHERKTSTITEDVFSDILRGTLWRP